MEVRNDTKIQRKLMRMGANADSLKVRAGRKCRKFMPLTRVGGSVRW